MTYDCFSNPHPRLTQKMLQPDLCVPHVNVRKFGFTVLASRFKSTHLSSTDQLEHATWHNQNSQPPPKVRLHMHVECLSSVWGFVFCLFDFHLLDFCLDSNSNLIFMWFRTELKKISLFRLPVRVETFNERAHINQVNHHTDFRKKYLWELLGLHAC